MSKVILSQSEIPFPEDWQNGNKVTRFRYRVVNSNRNIVSDWSVINYAEQDVLKYQAQNGMPIGGTTGQVPAKESNTDYDIGWFSVTELIPAGTYAPANNDYVSLTDDSEKLLPLGGSEGQVLTKQSGLDYDAIWETPTVTDPQDANVVIASSMFA